MTLLIGGSALVYAAGVYAVRRSNAAQSSTVRSTISPTSMGSPSTPEVIASESTPPVTLIADPVAEPGLADQPPVTELTRPVEIAKQATVFVLTDDGSGSAFCVDPRGIFVTNAHVVRPLSIGATLTLVSNPGQPDSRKHLARIIRIDAANDLALLAVDEFDQFETVPLGQTSSLDYTDDVTLFGFPFGKFLAAGNSFPSVSVNVGRIAALRPPTPPYDLIQIDASINPGNSGGPTIDAEGKVIGVVANGIRNSRVSNLIPVERVKELLAQPMIRVFAPASINAWEFEKPIEIGFEAIEGSLSANASWSVCFHPPGANQQPITAALGTERTTVHLDRPDNIPPSALLDLKISIASTPGDSAKAETFDLEVSARVVQSLSNMLHVPESAVPSSQTITLPGRVTRARVGGNGTKLVTLLGEQCRLSVIDLRQAKLKSTLDVLHSGVLFAAGKKQLVTVNPATNQFSSFDFETMELLRQRTIRTAGTITNIAMGSHSEGPLLVTSQQNGIAEPLFLNPETFSEVRVELEFNDRLDIPAEKNSVRANAEGTLFSIHSLKKTIMLRFVDGQIETTSRIFESRYAIPSFDGSLLFSSDGTYSAFDNTETQMSFTKQPLWGATDSTFLFSQVDAREGRNGFGCLLAERFDAPIGFFQTIDEPEDQFTSLWPDEKFVLSINHEILAQVQAREIHLFRFNMSHLLADLNRRFLFITSTPPQLGRVGNLYQHQVTACGDKSDRSYQLNEAPDGMTINDTGLIQWIPKRRHVVQPQKVELQVTAGGLKSTPLSFEIRVAN